MQNKKNSKKVQKSKSVYSRKITLQKNKVAFEKVTSMIKQRKYVKHKSCRIITEKEHEVQPNYYYAMNYLPS